MVSKGHAPVDIPAVVGLSESKATRALEEAGFVVERTTGFSKRVIKGRVLAVTPEEGSTEPYGSAATLTISLGPETFPVPDFMGMDRASAQALADEWGLKLAILAVPATDGSNVISQLPTPGTTVRYGQTISLWAA